MDIKTSVQRVKFIKLPLWASSFAILVAFILGIFLGGSSVSQKGTSVIRGVDPDFDNSAGVVENTDNEIPEYLTKDVDFDLFWDIWDMIQNEYYEEDIPETKLFYGALAGMVASLGDPHTVFFTPENTDDFREELNGSFEGIGAEIGIRNDSLTVIAPLDDSPALKSGLQPKDAILEIDGEETKGMSLSRAVSLIRGEKGTEVILTIYREGLTETKDIVIVRGAIKVKSLELEFKESIAYVKIRQFNAQTVPLFNDAIVEIMQTPNIVGVILDLRYNPGGYLQAAIDVAGEWVDGEVVVREKLRGGEEVAHSANRQARLDSYKTVVLVNAGSASGSEIVAGALQDLDRATIVGEQTFGKGSVQQLNNLKDGSSVKLTIAKWFTPNNNSIDGNGIIPDVEIEMTEEDYNSYLDPQLDKAISIIKYGN